MQIQSLLGLLLLVSVADGRIINQCVSRGHYAMTWDDGPAQFTGQLLDTLDAKKVKATFHVTTAFLTDPSVQSMIQRIAGAGHLIGLRTEAHWDLFKMSDEQIRAGVARQANVLSSFIGYFPKFIRLPYNGFDQRVLAAIESTGLIATTHNLETYDYNNDGVKTLNAVKLSLSLVGKGQGSFISIQHDGVQQSVGIAGKVIDAVRGAGYKLVKLDECMGLGDMTKNKEALKGADDSVDLGPMAIDGAPVPPGGSNPMGGPMDGGAPDANLAGQAQGNSSATVAASSTFAAAMIALIFALLF